MASLWACDTWPSLVALREWEEDKRADLTGLILLYDFLHVARYLQLSEEKVQSTKLNNDLTFERDMKAMLFTWKKRFWDLIWKLSKHRPMTCTWCISITGSYCCLERMGKTLRISIIIFSSVPPPWERLSLKAITCNHKICATEQHLPGVIKVLIILMLSHWIRNHKI